MKNRKGIILAGGSGTRLYPLTKIISKQLLPIYDKPMIFYPISTLMLAGIRDILIISTPRDVPQYRALLGNGSEWGINITYAIQESPDGLAQAFIIGEDFLNGSPSALILGDNIFYGNNFENKLINASNNSGATIFIYHVQHPQHYGVAELDSSNKVIGLEEKPSNPKSNYAVTGLYFYDEKAAEYARSVKPSSRGELEITDLNQIYLNNSQLHTSLMSRGYSWFDAGTHQTLLEAQQFVAIIERHQGLKISCPEEIAYRKKWISNNQLSEITSKIKNNYGNYLKNLLKHR